MATVDNKTIDDVISLVQTYSKDADTNLILRAYDYARDAHSGTLRRSGEPYITHPVQIAYILAGLESDVETIAAGLLHDVVEDTANTTDDITREFGSEIAYLVDGVTKITKLNFNTETTDQVETFRKMFVAMAKDVRVIIIKLADRLHNMRTLGSMPPEKQRKKSMETLDIYAPIAHRLGIYTMKMEFEDLSLKYLYPEKYEEIVGLVNQFLTERQEYINALIGILSERLERESIKFEIFGRPKHYYSIYKKMQSGKAFSEIFDLIAVRVLVDTENDCYAVLGWVHTLWKPIPGRIKDYIAMPKQNKYQSLHTTVIGPGGKPVEIQIRTYDMHRVAEYGIAAHAQYKEGNKGPDELGEWLRWLLEIKEIGQEVKDSDEFMDDVKKDLIAEEVFVYTPKGKVIELPAGATPIDFAYRIHSDVGNKCTGAKVNGKIVPLSYKLKTADFVEIITSPTSKGPSRDWLSVAISAHARSKIRAFFRKADKEENVTKGKDMLEREIRAEHLNTSDIIRNEYQDFICERFNVLSWDDLFSAIGYGGIRPKYVVQRIIERFAANFAAEESAPVLAKVPKTDTSRAVHIQGHSDLDVKFAKCCRPVPGDPIIGYITRGRGVSVHRADCVNILNSTETDRFIDVHWLTSDNNREKFSSELLIKAIDRPRLISDVSTLIGNEGINISGISSRTGRDSIVVMNIDVIVTNTHQLDRLVEKLGSISNVIGIYRV